MPANTVPIYPLTPKPSWDTETAANNTYTGTGTVGTVFTAGANGSYVSAIKLKPNGTNVASVARFFLNNGSDNNTAANNTLIGEISLPATTAIATAALIELALPLNIPIPASYRIMWVLGTAVAAGWTATAIAGDY